MKTDVFKKYPEIKLVYLFGSRAEGKEGPMSDYDFAIYFDEKTSSEKQFQIKLRLMGDLSDEFKTDKIDVVVLNDKLDPLLKYQAIRGKLIYIIEPYKIIIEPQVLSEYFDFKVFLKHHRI